MWHCGRADMLPRADLGLDQRRTTAASRSKVPLRGLLPGA